MKYKILFSKTCVGIYIFWTTKNIFHIIENSFKIKSLHQKFTIMIRANTGNLCTFHLKNAYRRLKYVWPKIFFQKAFYYYFIRQIINLNLKIVKCFNFNWIIVKNVLSSQLDDAPLTHNDYWTTASLLKIKIIVDYF